MNSILLIVLGLFVIMCPILICISPDAKKHDANEICRRNRRMMIFAGVFFSLIIVAGGFLFCRVISQQNALTENCVAIDVPTFDKILFYDEEREEYFFTKCSDWNLKTIVVRDVIDYNDGKVIHENVEEMKNAIENIKDKMP